MYQEFFSPNLFSFLFSFEMVGGGGIEPLAATQHTMATVLQTAVGITPHSFFVQL